MNPQKKARKGRLLERLERERHRIAKGQLSTRFRKAVARDEMTREQALTADLKRQDARIAEAKVGLE